MTLMISLEAMPTAAPERTSRRAGPFLHPGSPDPALVEHGRVITHDALARRVADLADRLPPVATGRRLVHLPLARDVAGIVGHLAVQAAGHVALVTGPGAESITERFAPDLRLTDEHVETLVEHAAHLLHPDLALLLSTSGSTGSPKLVRLSHDNITSNAAGIAEALGLGPTDRAITSLPLHYCYGLSVLHSTLHVGGSVVVTDQSVTDDAFWREHVTHQVSVLAGVPHTFDLIEPRLRGGLSGLRLVTQAGGALAPDRITQLTEIGRAQGWQLGVMYGQTEATARMAIHIGDGVAQAPEAVGHALVGSAVRVDRAGHEDRDDGAGELVFTGPGVMLGYAEHPDELALGRMIDELRTGDLGHVDEDGLVRVVGRCDQVAKILGLRIDLGRVNAALTGAGHRAMVTADAQHLLVTLVTDPAEGSTPRLLRSVRGLAAQASGLQPGAVVVAPVHAIPLLPGGKTDRIACREHALASIDREADTSDDDLAATVSIVASALGRDEADPDRSFAQLGGDSYNLVQTSVRLERVLGTLPDGWHHIPLRQLAQDATPPGRHVHWVDTPLLLRAVAAIAICASHLGLVAAPGGAHTLLALAGWSMSRFTLDTPEPTLRRRSGLRSIAALAIPSMVVALIGLVTAGGYGWENVLLVNWLIGEMEWGARINLWFIEALLACSLGVLALLSVPRLGLVHVRHPWAWSMALAAAALVPRWILVPDSTGATRGLPGSVLWLFAIGMALGVARTRRQRVATMALTGIGMWDFFVEPSRGLTVLVAITVLAFVPRIPLPRLLVLPLGLLAAASLHVYLVQWQVFRVVDQPVLALLTSFAAGIAVWWLFQAPTRALTDRLVRLRPTLPTPTGDPS